MLCGRFTGRVGRQFRGLKFSAQSHTEHLPSHDPQAWSRLCQVSGGQPPWRSHAWQPPWGPSAHLPPCAHSMWNDPHLAQWLPAESLEVLDLFQLEPGLSGRSGLAPWESQVGPSSWPAQGMTATRVSSPCHKRAGRRGPWHGWARCPSSGTGPACLRKGCARGSANRQCILPSPRAGMQIRRPRSRLLRALRVHGCICAGRGGGMQLDGHR